MSDLTAQMQGESADSGFIVAGFDIRNASLYHVDGQGLISSHTDIGFLSIGSGGIHSSAYFMQKPYTHIVGFHQAVADTFFAKKRSEICPGVGNLTDMQLITGDGITPVNADHIKILERGYKSYQKTLSGHVLRTTKRMTDLATRQGVHMPIKA